MHLNINTALTYRLRHATDLLLQIEVAKTADQNIDFFDFKSSETTHFARVEAEAGLGERVWIRAADDFHCAYSCRVEVDRPALDIASLTAVPAHLLPGDTVRYLMPSRFCPSDRFQAFVAAEFDTLEGGARIAAMRDWVNEAFTYARGSSDASTTALDTFVQRQGVCRDFAHVMIALARASTIPARFASVYAPDVTPQDFHAVAEVFLDGTWHLVDATGMAPANSIAKIGVGMDAAEVAFLTGFGPIEMVEQSVSVSVGSP